RVALPDNWRCSKSTASAKAMSLVRTESGSEYENSSTSAIAFASLRSASVAAAPGSAGGAACSEEEQPAVARAASPAARHRVSREERMRRSTDTDGPESLALHPDSGSAGPG